MTRISYILFIFSLFVTGMSATTSTDMHYLFSNMAILPQNQPPDSINTNVKLGRNVLYRKGQADAYLMIAELEEQNQKFASALRYYFSAIYELDILGDSLLIADIKIRIGNIFSSNQLFDKALEYYSEAERIYLQSGKISDHEELLLNIGQVYYKKEDYLTALKYYSRVIVLQQQKPEDTTFVYTYFGMVKCYNALQQHDKSLEYNILILNYIQKTGNRKEEITALNNVGYSYKNLVDFTNALLYFDKAGAIEKEINGLVSPVTLVNKAIVYQNMGNNSSAIRLLNDASSAVKRIKNEEKTTQYHHLTALVYFILKDYHNALIYNRKCIHLAGKYNSPEILENAYLLASRIYTALYNYEEAMISYLKHLHLKDSLQREQLFSQQELNNIAFRVEQITRETESLWASEELSYLELQRLKLDSANRQQEMEILYKADSIQRITIQNQQLENQRAQQALLLKEEQIYAANKKKEVDSLRQIEKIQSLELETQQLIRKEQDAQIELLDKENKIAELDLRKVRTRIKWLSAFGVLLLFIIYMVYRGLRYAKKTNKILLKQKNEIERQKDEIEYERLRSDKLLLNILPEETAEELKEKGSATPKHYALVSVLFTDFKGFTNIAEKLTPQELVAELNACFLEFDKIIDRHNLEKIKTIGDAYMCAGGIPVANDTNPDDVVKAGLEIKTYMENLKAERETNGEDFWELRIGIHTGQVIAGVVGKNKFAYDIWGDAVNTASRMESSGIPGKVNISGATYELIKNNYQCTYRGKIKAKNKGEIDMYIVERENSGND